MQQYPVPQFTDIEDRIIGRFTLKQFGIIFAAGGVVFFIFSSTKNIPATIIAGLLLGFPAIFVALFPFNGRPLYNILPLFFKHFTSPKLLVFHKQVLSESGTLSSEEKVEVSPIVRVSAQAATSRLKELNYLLQQKAAEEETLLKSSK